MPAGITRDYRLTARDALSANEKLLQIPVVERPRINTPLLNDAAPSLVNEMNTVRQ